MANLLLAKAEIIQVCSFYYALFIVTSLITVPFLFTKSNDIFFFVLKVIILYSKLGVHVDVFDMTIKRI